MITKLAHLHFPATEKAAERLRCMDGASDTIHAIGAPGLVGMADRPVPDAATLRTRLGLTDAMSLALCLFHPVVQEAGQAAEQVRVVVEATRAEGYAMAIRRPGSSSRPVLRFLALIPARAKMATSATPILLTVPT